MSTENYPLSNPDHERFIQNVANGMQPADAYLTIYTCKKRNAHKSASRLMQRPEIRDRLRHLQTCNAEVSMWKRSDAMDILRQIAENPNKKDCDRINAVNLLNQMCGYTEPEQKKMVQQNFFQFLSADKGIKGE